MSGREQGQTKDTGNITEKFSKKGKEEYKEMNKGAESEKNQENIIVSGNGFRLKLLLTLTGWTGWILIKILVLLEHLVELKSKKFRKRIKNLIKYKISYFGS